MSALTLAVLITGSVSALADDMPDPAKTPGAILGTVPDDQVASCLSDKAGTNVQVDNAITVALICTPGYSKCIRNVPQAEKNAVYQSYGLAGNHTGYCDTKQGCEASGQTHRASAPTWHPSGLADFGHQHRQAHACRHRRRRSGRARGGEGIAKAKLEGATRAVCRPFAVRLL